VKTLWGMEEAGDVAKWDGLFASIAAKGYAGIEGIRPFWQLNPDLLVELLNKHGLALVCQLHTCAVVEGSEFKYQTSSKLEDHKQSFTELVEETSQILTRVKAGGFLNSHSGSDRFRLDEAVDYLLHALEVEKRAGIKVTHETHRQRIFFNPFQTEDLLRHPALQGKPLKLNADLSHWCVVCERVFDPENEPRDDWWPDFLNLLSQHVEFCHCRCGWAEAPQISDPSAPEHRRDLDLHLGWWRHIWRAQHARGGAECWVEPEYGPPPYMPCLPHSGKPVADLEGVVETAKGQLEAAFEREFPKSAQ